MSIQRYPLSNWNNSRNFNNTEVIYLGESVYLISNGKFVAKKSEDKRFHVTMGCEFDMNKNTMKHLSVFMGLQTLSLQLFSELVNTGYIAMEFVDLRIELKEKL